MTEDFTSFTEQDALGRLSQTAARSTFAGLDRTDDSIYLWKNYGTNYFTNFVYDFEIYLDASTLSAVQINRLMYLTITDTRNDWKANNDASNTQFGVMCAAEDPNHSVRVGEGFGGSSQWGSAINISLDTLYYCRLIKEGTALDFYVYSNSARTTLVGSSSVTLNADHALEYLLCPQSMDLTGSYTSDGYLEDLQFGGAESLFAEFNVPNTGSADLLASFDVGQDSIELKGVFHAGQGSHDLFSEVIIRQTTTQDLFAEAIVTNAGSEALFAEFINRQSSSEELFAELISRQSVSEELFSKFISRQAGTGDLFADLTVRALATYSLFAQVTVQQQASLDLLAKFEVGQGSRELLGEFTARQSASQELYARFWVSTTYDGRRSRGVSFMWWGSGIPDMIEFEVETPSGRYIGSFTDGDPPFRWILMRWSDMTAINSPNLARIRGIYWTYHTQGVRRLDKVGLYNCADLLCSFNLRQATEDLYSKFESQTSIDLFARAIIRQSDSGELPAEMVVTNPASENLFAEFWLADHENLFSKFYVGQLEANLFAEMIARQPSSEELFAEFQVAQWSDLMAQTYIAQIFEQDSDEVIVDDSISAWVNYIENVGRGFISAPSVTDSPISISGTDSLRLSSTYLDDSYEGIKFGWRGGPIDGSRNRGIGFFWRGAGGVPDMIEFIIETQTGFFLAKFTDGAPPFRWIYFLYENMTQSGIVGTPPDPSLITGIYWVYHTPGVRQLDLIAWYSPSHLKGVFTLRQLTSDLKAVFAVDQFNASSALKARFEVGQDSSALRALMMSSKPGPPYWVNGFESGFSGWDGTFTQSTIEVQSTIKYSGGYASKARVEDDEQAYSYVTLPDVYDDIIINLKVYFDSRGPISRLDFFRLLDSNGNEIVSLGFGEYLIPPVNIVNRWVVKVKDEIEYTSPPWQNIENEKWYKIKLRVKRGASDGYVKLWVHRGDVNVYEDEPGFWTLANSGPGLTEGVLSDDTSDKFSGELSAKVNHISGSYGGQTLRHTYPFGEGLDWSEHDNIRFAFEGENAQQWIYLQFGDELMGNYWWDWIFDDFAGWRKYTFVIDKMNVVDGGGLNISNIRRIEFAWGSWPVGDELIGKDYRFDRVYATRNPLSDEGLQIDQTDIDTDSGYSYAEIHSGITNYPVLLASWAEVYTDDVHIESTIGDLKAVFEVGQDSADLKTVFNIRYDVTELFSKFTIA